MQLVISCNGLGKKPLHTINWLSANDVSIDFIANVDIYYVRTSV